MEYKTTTKLKQSTLWQRPKLIMTHNFTELKADAEAEFGTLTEPKTKWYPCYHGNHDLLNLKFRKMRVWL